MGFIDTSPETRLPVFYNVVHAVGKESPNLRDDVKMVQYLLMAFYDKAELQGLSKPKGEIGVTGYCGPATMNWIRKFQIDVRYMVKGNIALDDRVDRIRDKTSFKGSITKTVYTLAFLNWFVAKENPDAYLLLPAVIPLENAANAPPPSWDVIREIKERVTPPV